MQAVGRSYRALRGPRVAGRWPAAAAKSVHPPTARAFAAASRLAAVKPFLLADIGEGIKEVQIIQWFVQPGARVEQFDKICEVQSDKASVDITSRFDGVIKKLHYEPDAMAQVGKPLLDIDITGDVSPADAKLLQTEDNEAESSADKPAPQPSEPVRPAPPAAPEQRSAPPSRASAGHLATPAVRGLLKEHDVDISEVQGTGRDGRVTKDDVRAFAAARDNAQTSSAPTPSISSQPAVQPGPQVETEQALTPMQAAMHRTMTRSLAIPHFLWATEVDLTSLTGLRSGLNAAAAAPEQKLSALAFIIKAVSLSLHHFPLLNARLSNSSAGTPRLVHRAQHNVSVAIDSPAGLIVPNIKGVQGLSVGQIGAELRRLAGLAAQGRLGPADLAGGTIAVSNIGSIGGSHATPLLVDDQLAILAVGRAEGVPRFDAAGAVMRREVAVFNWQADHRVVDGATLARMGESVRHLLEEPGLMLAEMR